MAGIGLPDPDVVAVLDKHLGQGERQTVDLVEVSSDEEHATGLVGDRHAIGKLGREAKAIEDRFFLVVPGDTRRFLEDLGVFVGPLIVDTVEFLIEDRLHDRAEVS